MKRINTKAPYLLNLFFGLVAAAAVIIFLVQLAIVTLVVKGAKSIEKQGLKNVIERVWTGPTNETVHAE